MSYLLKMFFFTICITIAHLPFAYAEKNSRIIGGTEVTSIDEHPWLAALIYDDNTSPECGSAIIHQYWAVTAAHCVENKEVSDVRIRIGTLRTDTREGAMREINQIIIHPEWGESIHRFKEDTGLVKNDIALLRVSAPFDREQIIAWNTDANFPIAETDANIAGWGNAHRLYLRPPDTLMETTLPVVSHDDCQNAYDPYRYIIPNSMMCTGLLGIGGRDSCYGDSGGPLTTKRQGEAVLIGIVSWGAGCGQADFPSVNTRISSFSSWINDIIEADISPKDTNITTRLVLNTPEAHRLRVNTFGENSALIAKFITKSASTSNTASTLFTLELINDEPCIKHNSEVYIRKTRTNSGFQRQNLTERYLFTTSDGKITTSEYGNLELDKTARLSVTEGSASEKAMRFRIMTDHTDPEFCLESHDSFIILNSVSENILDAVKISVDNSLTNKDRNTYPKFVLPAQTERKYLPKRTYTYSDVAIAFLNTYDPINRDGDNWIVSKFGTYTLIGGDGHDLLGAIGADKVSAGAGDDTLYLDMLRDDQTNLYRTTGHWDGGEGHDTIYLNVPEGMRIAITVDSEYAGTVYMYDTKDFAVHFTYESIEAFTFNRYYNPTEDLNIEVYTHAVSWGEGLPDGLAVHVEPFDLEIYNTALSRLLNR